MSTDLQGFYESHPVLTRFTFRQAARRSNLTVDQRSQLFSFLADAKQTVAAGQALDDLDASTAAERTAKLGDGTILQLLISNLPAIIAAIQDIIKMFPTAPATKSVAGLMESQASHGGTEFMIPPQLLLVIEPLAEAMAKALWAYVKPEIDEYVSGLKVAA